MKPFRKIMLVEDDEVSSFIFSKLISITKFATNTITFQKADDALSYIKDNVSHDDHLPEVIFLDLILYDMDGWNFLEKYELLDASVKAKIYLVILTTSLFENDRIKAGNYPSVKKFIQKPISTESLLEIYDELKKIKK